MYTGPNLWEQWRANAWKAKTWVGVLQLKDIDQYLRKTNFLMEGTRAFFKTNVFEQTRRVILTQCLKNEDISTIRGQHRAFFKFCKEYFPDFPADGTTREGWITYFGSLEAWRNDSITAGTWGWTIPRYYAISLRWYKLLHQKLFIRRKWSCHYQGPVSRLLLIRAIRRAKAESLFGATETSCPDVNYKASWQAEEQAWRASFQQSGWKADHARVQQQTGELEALLDDPALVKRSQELLETFETVLDLSNGRLPRVSAPDEMSAWLTRCDRAVFQCENVLSSLYSYESLLGLPGRLVSVASLL